MWTTASFFNYLKHAVSQKVQSKPTGRNNRRKSWSYMNFSNSILHTCTHNRFILQFKHLHKLRATVWRGILHRQTVALLFYGSCNKKAEWHWDVCKSLGAMRLNRLTADHIHISHPRCCCRINGASVSVKYKDIQTHTRSPGKPACVPPEFRASRRQRCISKAPLSVSPSVSQPLGKRTLELWPTSARRSCLFCVWMKDCGLMNTAAASGERNRTLPSWTWALTWTHTLWTFPPVSVSIKPRDSSWEWIHAAPTTTIWLIHFLFAVVEELPQINVLKRHE